MKIFVMQLYTEAGVSFPFTHRFQRYISEAIDSSICLPPSFGERFGNDFKIVFRMNAKDGLGTPVTKGPVVYKKYNNMEYMITLPLDQKARIDELILKQAVEQLLLCIATELTSWVSIQPI